ILILLVLLYCLFKINNIDITELFTHDGFSKIYNNNKWIIYLAITIIIYASYSMYISCYYDYVESKAELKSKSKLKSKSESKLKSELFIGGKGELLNFDLFYKKFFINNCVQYPNTYLLFR